MAFIKSLKLNTGIEVTYWRLESVQVNKRSRKVTARFSGYKDKATRDDGMPAMNKEITFSIEDIDITKDIFEQAYRASKHAEERIIKLGDSTTPFFADATNA